MNNYTYYNPGKIIFGKECEKNVGAEVAALGCSRCLLVLGGPFIKQLGLYDVVAGSLKEAGVACFDLDDIVPNPQLDKVYEGIDICKREGIDFVLAIGGGSAIDTAKAVAAGVKAPDDIWSFFGTWEKAITDALPCGVILTLPATGSESSNCAVITNEKIGLKRSLFSNFIRPRFAMLDPETSYSLPKYQMASGAADILAHLMESYFTKVTHVDFTDRLLEGAMRSVLHIAPIAIEEPTNYDAKAELYQAANITNNDMLWAGRIGDWGSHNIEHELSGVYKIAHGAGLAMIFPSWIRYVWKQCPGRFVQWAQRVFDVEFAAGEEERTVMAAVDQLESFYRRIGLPARLSEAGIDNSRFEEMAKKAMIGVNAVGMQFPLNYDDILSIFNMAL